MKLLGIETTGPFCSAALCVEDKIYEIAGTKKLNHLSSLTPMIKTLMEEKCVKFTELDAICVSEGPGSFTGIRIGVSTARALSQVAKVPIISVPTLYAFGRDILGKIANKSAYDKMFDDAKIAKSKSRADVESGGFLPKLDSAENQKIAVGNVFSGEYLEDVVACPVFNARRNQVYAGAYIGKKEMVKAGPYMLDEFMDLLKAEISSLVRNDNALSVYFAGDGVEAYENVILEMMPQANLLKMYQRAHGICDMVFYMLDNKEIFMDKINLSPEEVRPNYMRMAEAERKLREGKL